MKFNRLLLLGAMSTSMLVMAADIDLPKPQTKGGMSLMEALSQRQTIRSISDKPLSMQTVSDLLWAANGFNRPEKRTAPTARNYQEQELYILLPDGAYFYDAKNNKLLQVSSEKNSGAATVVIVCDTKKQPDMKYCAVDAGFIGQNIYLYCASKGLATVFRGRFDHDKIVKMLPLKEGQRVLFVQTVGHVK